ncbi:MAG: YfhO family protein [Bacteroidota bacterium]
MKTDYKKLLPHVFAIVLFLVVALLYCKPALDGLAIQQHDLTQWKGMAQDGYNYKEKHGDFPEWTNGMFSGMPAYNIAFESNAYLPAIVTKIMGLWLPEPFIYFFLACVAFYFLSQVLRINPWIGVIGALGFAYSSYNPIIIVTGHHTKMMTIAIMPALLASLFLVFENRKYWLGGALIGLFTSAVVVFNHLQMVFYMLIMIAFMVTTYAIVFIKTGQIKRLLTAGSIALMAAVLGALVCAVNLFTTYDYSKESMRGGKASLAADTTGVAKKASTGLDVEYAFRWSYGIPETYTLIVANANGGGSQSLGEESKFYESLVGKVQAGQIDQNLAQQVAQFGATYWGDQPFTSGPVYLGAIICFLFILGMTNVKSYHKWWILAVSILAIVMAWGSNFMGFNEFLFNYLPMYNKFRAPSQSLVIPQLLFPVVGMMGLQQLLFDNSEATEKWKALKLAGIITGCLLLLATLFYVSADYSSAREKEAIQQIAKSNPSLSAPIKEVIAAAGEDRKALYQGDLIRTFVLAGLGFLILMVFVKQKMKPVIPLVVLLFLNAFDLLAVGKRYLSDENYAEKEVTEPIAYMQQSNPQLYNALNSINQDKDPHFRVFNATGDPFNDALTSALVRSVGGYHPAKLSVYNDLIENQLSKQNMNVFNMLNTKYFIVQGEKGLQPQQNQEAFGAAWFVKTIYYVPDAHAEMKSLDSLNLKDTAIVDQQFKSSITANPVWDSSANIKLVKYDNDIIEYSVNTPSPQFAVLSEIYYSRGWSAYADGKEVPIVKTNYALRGVPVPAGTKKLELRFEPKSYTSGRMVTNIASLALILMLGIGFFMEYRKNEKKVNRV